jgi:hypothetical protein
VDVREEILDLKLRVEDLETTAEQAGGLERQEALLREIVERSRRLQAEVASLKAQLARTRTEIGEEFAAVGTEVEGVGGRCPAARRLRTRRRATSGRRSRSSSA